MKRWRFYSAPNYDDVPKCPGWHPVAADHGDGRLNAIPEGDWWDGHEWIKLGHLVVSWLDAPQPSRSLAQTIASDHFDEFEALVVSGDETGDGDEKGASR